MVGLFKALEDAVTGKPSDANASKGTRNNNEGNLEDGPFARSLPGYAGSDGRFAKFKTPEDGAHAQERLLQKNYAGMTPAGVVKKYAPRADNSEASMRNYIGYASSRVGIDPDQPVPPEKLREFAAAMREFETGKTQKIKFNPYGGAIEGSGPGAPGMATTPTTVRDVTQVNATDSEKMAMQAPYSGPAGGNPFDPEVQKRVSGAAATVQNRASLADALIQATIPKIQDTKTEALQELNQTTAAKRALYEHGKETTQALIDASTPIFQQRKQIQDRRSEIARTNPFLAAIKGVLDPDYNSDALESRDNILKGDQQLLDEEYTHQSRNHDRLIAITAAESQDQQVLYNAMLENMDSDMKLAVQSYEGGGMLLSAAMTPIQTSSALLAAKNTQTNQWLENASEGQINEAMKLAAAPGSGGIANVNGIEVPIARLQKAQEDRVEGAYHMAALKSGHELQNQALIEQGQKNFLRTASLPVLQEAMKNGGMIDGVQFDLTEIGRRFETLKAVNAGQAEDAVLQSVPGQFQATVTTYTQSQRGYSARLTSMFGALPDQFSTSFAQDATRLAQIASQVHELNQSGNRDAALQLVNSTTVEVQKMIERRDKQVESYVDKWSGGNADYKQLGMAFATGTQVEPGAATRALIGMARNGVPAGMKFQGTSAKVFGVIQKEVELDRQKRVGDDKLKGTADDLDRALIGNIQGKLNQMFNSDMITNVLTEAPNTAKQVQVNGRPHPFSMVSRQMMNEAINYGDTYGWDLAARDMNLGVGKGSVLKELFSKPNPASSPEWKALAGTLKPGQQDVRYWQERVKSGQVQGMYKSLDMHRTDSMPFAPSTMLQDLMQRPQFRESGVIAGSLIERASMGGFAATAAAGGTLRNSLDTYSTRAVAAFQPYRAQQVASITDKGVALRTQPLARTSYVLSSLPGITDAEEKVWLNHVKANIPQGGSTGTALGTAGQEGMAEAEMYGSQTWDTISRLTTTKAEDPAVEAIRKKIAPKWQEYSDSADKMSKSPWFAGGNK